MAGKNQSSQTARDMEPQGKEAPTFVPMRLSREQILADAIRGLRADLSKIKEAHSN